MMVKLHKHSRGSAKGAADYQRAKFIHPRDPVTGRNQTWLPKVERAVPPEHLRGNWDAVVQITESLKFEHTHTSGTIAFALDDNPTKEQINEVVDSFMHYVSGGLDPNRLSAAWNIHKDKGNVEVNFLIARVDLETGKSLNIAPPGHEPYFNAWRDCWNDKMGWASPNDPSRRRELKLNEFENKPLKETKEAIHSHIEALILEGAITPDREGVLTALHGLGEITRTGKDYVSIKPEGFEKAIRLKGSFYSENFFDGASDPAQLVNANSFAKEDGVTAQSSPERSTELSERLEENARQLYEKRSRFFQERYGHGGREFRSPYAENDFKNVAVIPSADSIHLDIDGLGNERGLDVPQILKADRNTDLSDAGWKPTANGSFKRKLPEHLQYSERPEAMQTSHSEELSNDRNRSFIARLSEKIIAKQRDFFNWIGETASRFGATVQRAIGVTRQFNSHVSQLDDTVRKFEGRERSDQRTKPRLISPIRDFDEAVKRLDALMNPTTAPKTPQPRNNPSMGL